MFFLFYFTPPLTLSPSPPRSAPATIDRMPENLTPARKHHKLLKDGSEVWSKEVEKIFVDGASPISSIHASRSCSIPPRDVSRSS